MASSSSSSHWKYDVFLSFRGVDTRYNFTSHLLMELCRRGINTFIDDKKLERGEVITPALITAIKNSRTSIVVLSENYASSRWCLEELVKILECKRTKGQRVIPIFHNVNPSDVRDQRGKIGEAMDKHEKNLKKMERVKIWRDALTEVANLSGWDSRNKNEAVLIEEIVQSILMDDPLRNSIDDGMGPLMDPHDLDIVMAAVGITRALIRSFVPYDIDLKQFTATEIIGKFKQFASHLKDLKRSIISEDKGIVLRETQVSRRADRRLFHSHIEEVRSISSDHDGEDLKGQGKLLSKISGCKNLSLKFRTSVRARILGLTWSTTIKARLRAKQVFIVLHYVNDSVVSSHTNASILILVLASWNLLCVLFFQSCEDVFHGSPVNIFCELKLSDLRTCEVGCFSNPLNWGDGVMGGSF